MKLHYSQIYSQVILRNYSDCNQPIGITYILYFFVFFYLKYIAKWFFICYYNNINILKNQPYLSKKRCYFRNEKSKVIVHHR